MTDSDDEAADLAWLEARERGVDGGPIDPARAASYARLTADLAALPDEPAPVGWRAPVLSALDQAAARPSRIRWLVVGAPIAAAAAIAVVWLVSSRGSQPTSDAGPGSSLAGAIAVRIIKSDRPARGPAPAAVGDTLVVEAAAPGELRIYHDDREVVLRCPGGASCDPAEPSRLRGRHVLEAPGTYRAVVIRGAAAAPTGTLDRDLAANPDAEVAVPVQVQ